MFWSTQGIHTAPETAAAAPWTSSIDRRRWLGGLPCVASDTSTGNSFLDRKSLFFHILWIFSGWAHDAPVYQPSTRVGRGLAGGRRRPQRPFPGSYGCPGCSRTPPGPIKNVLNFHEKSWFSMIFLGFPHFRWASLWGKFSITPHVYDDFFAFSSFPLDKIA